MKTATAVVIAFIVLASAAFSQTRCMQNDPSAVPIGRMTTSIAFQSNVEDIYKDSTGVQQDSTDRDTAVSGTKPKNNGQVSIEVLVWRINGQIIYSVDPQAITFSGSDEAIDSMPTMQLFDLMAQVIVGQGFANGFSGCSGTCGNTIVKVNFPACVARVGRGIATRLESCNPGYCCTRSYSICCPNGGGAPFVTLVGSTGAACSGSGPSGGRCESTCP